MCAAKTLNFLAIPVICASIHIGVPSDRRVSMEKVEGLMQKMTLSAAEKGVRVKDGGGGKKSLSPSANLIQAVGKLFS